MKSPLLITSNFKNSKIITYETDVNGFIKKINPVFTEVNGYTKNEIIDKHHGLLRHSDMPNIVMKTITDRLKTNNSCFEVIKNISKNGTTYWSLSYFKVKRETSNPPFLYIIKKKMLPKYLHSLFENIYAIIKKIEINSGTLVADKYLNGLLEYNNVPNYQGLIQKIYGVNVDLKKQFYSIENLSQVEEKSKLNTLTEINNISSQVFNLGL